MRTLSINTSSNLLSLALSENEHILSTRSLYMERGQGEALIPLIQELFLEAKQDIATLNQVIVAVGPGSFTGVRIALATARGIGLSLNIPVYGITDFEALITPQLNFPLCVAIDTKRGDFYAQIFHAVNQKSQPQILSCDEIIALNLPILTDKPDLFSSTKACLLSAPVCPAENMIRLIQTQQVQPCAPEPLYLREADVTLPK